MIPALLISFREVIEASLIVATIVGVLVKLGHTKSIHTVWLATGAATLLGILLLGIGSLFGLKVQEIYTGKIEEFIEAVLMVTSAIFITWAVFFLHTYFAQYKTKLLYKIRETVEREEQKGIFILVFTAVLREGLEIVLFLSTMYFSSNPASIFLGFLLGAGGALLVSVSLFTATIRLPVYQAFRATSVLLVLFAAGLLARGVHEFMEAGVLPGLTQLPQLTLTFIPHTSSFAGLMVQSVFGITQTMHLLQWSVYLLYIVLVRWRLSSRKTEQVTLYRSPERIP